MENHNTQLNKLLLMAIFVSAGLAMTGCSDVRDRLGIDPEIPDEFSVLERAPLHIPPNFALRPPLNEGETAPPTQLSASDEAKRALTGKLEEPRISERSKGQSILLDQAGQSDPDIRGTIDRELAIQTTTSDRAINNLIGPSNTPQDSTEVIDPKVEKKRLDRLNGAKLSDSQDLANAASPAMQAGTETTKASPQ